MTMCREQEWQLSLPLVVSDAISCLLHNLKTFWNIYMILHSYIEQVMMMCCIQEWQLSLSYSLSYFPWMASDAISCPLHYHKTVWNIFMILYSYVEQVMTMCRVQEWQLSLSYFLGYFPMIISDAISCPLCNLNTLWNIIMIHQLCRTDHDDLLRTRITTLIFSELFPLDGFRCNFVSAP